MNLYRMLTSRIMNREIGKRNIPRQLELLGASNSMVKSIEKENEYKQEEFLADFIEGKDGCILDWSVSGQEAYDTITPLLNEEEKASVPALHTSHKELPEVISMIRKGLSNTQRCLIHTNSLGDFTFVFILSKQIELEFSECVGDWLIKAPLES